MPPKANDLHQKITTISSASIAFTTFVGVGGGLAYYVSQILKVGVGYLALVEIIYIILTLWGITFIWGKLK